MKILLFITSYRQLEEFEYYRMFLEKLKLNALCDIYIYCNNPDISPALLHLYQKFKQTTKHLLISSINGGYRMGHLEALSKCFDAKLFQNYDYVIHMHPDVFFTDDTYLLESLKENMDNDVVFLVNKSNGQYNFFSTDFFIFKPKLLSHNIFSDELYTFTTPPEVYLYDMLHKYSINYIILKRFNNNEWYPRRIDDNLDQ